MAGSICSFLRKELKVKGKTMHTGRGCYWMWMDIGWEEVVERINKQLVKWEEKGLVEKKKITDDDIQISFVSSVTDDGYYRHLYIDRNCVNSDKRIAVGM